MRAWMLGGVGVALLIHHATRVRHILLSFVASLAQPYFSTLSHKRHDFREKVTEHKICVLISSTTLSKTFLNLRRSQRHIVMNVKSLHVKHTSFLSDFNET